MNLTDLENYCWDIVSATNHVRITPNSALIAKIHYTLTKDPTNPIVNPDWSYFLPEIDNDYRKLLYILTVTSLNFCFFQKDLNHPHWTYKNGYGSGGFHLLMKEAYEKDRSFEKVIRDSHMPLAEERIVIIKSLLYAFKHKSAYLQTLVEDVHYDLKHAQTLADAFPYAFADPFLKKAQLALSIFNSTLEHPKTSYLTLFADYRIPQYLHHIGVLQYSDELEGIVNRQEAIPHGCIMEQSIRAATILVGCQVMNELRKQIPGHLRLHNFDSTKLDWFLFQQCRKSIDRMKPHHRCITTCY